MQGGNPPTLTRSSGASRRRREPPNESKKGEEKSAFKIVGGGKNRHLGIIYTPVWMTLISDYSSILFILFVSITLGLFFCTELVFKKYLFKYFSLTLIWNILYKHCKVWVQTGDVTDGYFRCGIVRVPAPPWCCPWPKCPPQPPTHRNRRWPEAHYDHRNNKQKYVIFTAIVTKLKRFCYICN